MRILKLVHLQLVHSQRKDAMEGQFMDWYYFSEY